MSTKISVNRQHWVPAVSHWGKAETLQISTNGNRIEVELEKNKEIMA
jgi:hypothetical protein